MLPRTLRETAAALAAFALSVVVAAGCGGGDERQDANEPEGEFPVEIVSASFPSDQKLAKDSTMEIVVKNVGDETIPNINVTVDDFYYRKDAAPGQEGTGLADPERPVFVINRIPTDPTPDEQERGEVQRDEKRLDPLERSSAYVDTYPLGELKEGETATFRWEVTAVKAGTFCIVYKVAAGLDGKAEAVLRGEQPEARCKEGRADEPGEDTDEPTGLFAGVISEKAPQARIAEDGETVLNE